jgi:hypothetical protein
MDQQHIEGGNGGSATVAAGGKYQIGDIEVDPISGGILPLLSVIDSPFLGAGPDSDDMDASDIMSAIYIIANKSEALRPLMGIERRRRALEQVRPMIVESSGHFDSFLRANEQVEQKQDDFDAAVLAFWDTLGDVDLQQACDTVFEMLTDAMSGFAEIPTDADDVEKKTTMDQSGSLIQC